MGRRGGGKIATGRRFGPYQLMTLNGWSSTLPDTARCQSTDLQARTTRIYSHNQGPSHGRHIYNCRQRQGQAGSCQLQHSNNREQNAGNVQRYYNCQQLELSVREPDLRRLVEGENTFWFISYGTVRPGA